ncbi:MAG: LytTR family transcriptional regulator DNA-binding domain-containing protein [Bacteroidota bacterium]
MMPKRIAILSFKTESIRLHYLMESIQDLLILELGRSSKYIVISKESVQVATTSEFNISNVANQLNASRILHGEVVEKEEIEVLLYYYRLNSRGLERFESKVMVHKSNTFQLGEKCLTAVKSFLNIHSIGDKPMGVQKLQHPELYQKFMLGNYHFNRWTQENVAEAIAMYREVIQNESGFAPAYLKLAKCYIFQAGRGFEIPKKVYPKARRAVEKALEINPNSGEAIINKNLVDFFYDLDWRTIYDSIEKGLENHVDASEAYQQLSFFWYGLQEYDAALDALFSALEYDPLSTGILNMIGDVQLSAKHFDESEKTFLAILKMFPNDFAALENLLYIAALQDNKNKCFRYLNKLQKLLPGDEKYVPRMAYAYGRFGMMEEAQEYLDYYEKLEKEQPSRVLHNFKAQVHAGLKDWDKALYYAEKGWNARTGILFILTDPQFEPIRRWERYQRLLAQIKFPKKIEDVNYFTLKTDTQETLRANLNALLFIRAEDNYSRLFFFQHFRIEEKLVRATLKTIQSQLPESFLRVHKTFLINSKLPFEVHGNSKTRYINQPQHDFKITVSRSFDITTLDK